MASLLLTPTAARAQALGFSASAPLNSNAGTDSGSDSEAQVVSNGAGDWVAIWSSTDELGGSIGPDLDILVARSTDDGASWTAPAPLNSNAATDAGSDLNPFLATDRAGNWIAVWRSDDTLGGTVGSDIDLFFARSTDNGASWSAPAPLNANAATDAGIDRDPRLATDGADNWIAVWRSGDDLGGTVGLDEDIHYAVSIDDGATWSAPAALNSNAASDTGDDFSPEIATDGAGNWVAMWYSVDSLGGTIGADRDILFARSTNDGSSWSAVAPLNSNAASDTGTDRSNHIAADGAGNWVAIWRTTENLGGTIGTDNDIVCARSTDGGATWTAPSVVNSNAAADSSIDDFPRVSTDGNGNWVAVWYTDNDFGGTIGSDDDIVAAHSTDNGLTWTAPAALNSYAASDAEFDDLPQISNDGAGHWIAVWYTNHDLGGAIGGDTDIIVAISSTVPVELSGFGLE